MRFDMLLTQNLLPVPDDIVIKDNFGHVAIQQDGKVVAGGDHVIVEATEAAVKRWLGRFDGVWIGNDPNIMLQKFVIAHIRMDE